MDKELSSKKKAVKETGRLISVDLKEDPITKSNKFVDKYKGSVYINEPTKSKVAEKIEKKTKGLYAIKY